MRNKVKEIRENKGLTQEELSKRASVSRTIISELENEKTDVITNITMEKIAKALEEKIPNIFFQE